MNKFEQNIADVLEVGEVDCATRFREVDGWCSLMAFGLLVAMENDWGVRLDVARLGSFETVGDLQHEAMCAFAAKLMNVDIEKLRTLTRHDIPQWDSINHLRLVMEIEPRFGVSYALERIPSLQSIRDFVS